MIINLRGTHGSGKSTVAARLMARFAYYPVNLETGAVDAVKRPEAYMVELPRGELLCIVGPYTTACGGCDAVQPYAAIWPKVEAAAKIADHVFFEGALISTTYGSIGQASETYGDDFVFAFMDTPLDVCVARVNARRAARGKGPLETTKNVDSKWTTIDRLRQKLLTGTDKVPRRRVAVIDHHNPLKSTLKLLSVAVLKEPT